LQEIAAVNGSTKTYRCSSHKKIPENECADAVVKAGYALLNPLDAKPTLDYVRKLAMNHL
jgi:hypothetical protein